jgi:hypothetical protein
MPQGTPPSFLEPEVLESFSCAAVKHRRPTLVPPARREVALGDPGGRAMRGGRQLCECVFRLDEGRLGLDEQILLEQREHEN